MRRRRSDEDLSAKRHLSSAFSDNALRPDALRALAVESRNRESRLAALPTLGPLQLIEEYLMGRALCRSRVVRSAAAAELVREFAAPLSSSAVAVLLTCNDEICVSAANAHTVVVLRAEGRHLLRYGREGSAVGDLHTPVAIASARNIFAVAERGNLRVQLWSRLDDNPRRILCHAISTCSHVLFPRTVALQPSDCSVVTLGDDNSSAVGQFSVVHDCFLRPLSLPEHNDTLDDNNLHRSVRALSYDRDDNLLVVPHWGDRIHIFSSDGVYKSSLYASQTAYTSLATDDAGHIVAADSANSRVDVYESGGGALLSSFSVFGDGDRGSDLSVAVNSRGHIIVLNAASRRVQVWR